MDIIINNEEIDFTLEGEQFVAQVITGIDEWLQPSGLIIQTVAVDGKTLSDINDAAATPVSETKRIEITAATVLPQTPEEIKTIITEQKQALADFKNKLDTIIGNLQAGKDSAAMAEIKNLCDTMESILVLLHVVNKKTDVKLEDIEQDGKNIKELNTDLTEILKDITEVINNKDIVQLCDLIEYELTPRLETWSGILATIENSI